MSKRPRGTGLPRLLTLCLILSASVCSVSAEGPASRDEIKNWLYTITDPEIVVDDLYKLEQIEKTVPTVTIPKIDYVLTKQGTLVVSPAGPLEIDTAGVLTYKIDIPMTEIPDFHACEAVGYPEILLWGGIGAVVGLLAGFGLGSLIR